MTCRHVEFTHGQHCLVEIQPPSGRLAEPAFTAFVSVIEDDGSIVRPLVQGDGHRVRIKAESEPVALTSAISFLERRFGTPSATFKPISIGTATMGSPIYVRD